MKTISVLSKAKQRIRLIAAPVVVTSLELKQADDLGTLFEGAEVEFKSPDGAIRGTIVDGTIQVMVTQEDLFEGIRAINPSTEALSLTDQVNALKTTLSGYDNFVDAVEDASNELSKKLKEATSKKVKSVAGALDIIKSAGIFVSVKSVEAPVKPEAKSEPKQEQVKASVAKKSLGMRDLRIK